MCRQLVVVFGEILDVQLLEGLLESGEGGGAKFLGREGVAQGYRKPGDSWYYRAGVSG